MSKKCIGKKIFGIALLGAAIGGAIAFFKKFENEQDDDFTGFDPMDSDACKDCDDCTPDMTRSYTTIAGEKLEETTEESESAAEETVKEKEAEDEKKDTAENTETVSDDAEN